MRLTIRTNLAMRTLMFCAVNPGRTVNKQEIAQACNVSENHLAQVIHLLARAGFLVTLRGRSGGMRLSRGPEAIRVGEVFRTFEAVLPFTECADRSANTCPLTAACRLRCVLNEALSAFYAVLDRTTVADLVQGNADLEELLKVA
jgi:Rrf2 family nitric oxide-sensitive transcriptional repressor